jgi:hypothetical protein
VKETIIAFCTPDMNRPTARRAIESLKTTDLRRAELMILENAYDDRFRHAAVMDEMLTYANGRPVIFMDDDAIVREPAWIDRLFQAATESGATVVGCAHTSVAGERNHTGILVYRDGSTELTREAASGAYAYVPAVSSALMLVLNDRGLRFDTRYEKYHHDTDIGLAAWSRGEKVACALGLEIEHAQADYAAKVSNVRDLLTRDLGRFREKWDPFIRDGLYERAELARFAGPSAETNWDLAYSQASALEDREPETAAQRFRGLIARCPNDWHRAGAHFHLYMLERDPRHLEACLAENPAHRRAAALLAELQPMGAR